MTIVQISLTDASAELVYLVEVALQGEEIVILKDDQPIAKLTSLKSIQKRRRQPGSAKGLVWMSDDFDEPLEDFKDYMD